MVALRGQDINGFMARPDPARPIILLYGPDAGLVRERADALIASAVDNPDDPFSMVKLDGDELAAEPSRLVDEAMTVPLFGGRRAIRIRAGSRSFASGVETLAGMSVRDCRIVIEAGDIRPDSPLRKACERAASAVAIGCYPDTERDLAKLIDDELRIANLRIAPDARASLMALLGGDRQASRNELRKLTLYAHGEGEVTLDHVMAVVADASEMKLDPKKKIAAAHCDGRRQLVPAGHPTHADRRTAAGGFDEDRQPQSFAQSGVRRRLRRPQHLISADRKSFGDKQFLGELFVHPRRAGERAGPDVGHAGEFE